MGFEVERTNRKLLLGNLHNVRFLPLEKMKKQLEKISHPILFACDFARVCNAMTIFFFATIKTTFLFSLPSLATAMVEQSRDYDFFTSRGQFPTSKFSDRASLTHFFGDSRQA